MTRCGRCKRFHEIVRHAVCEDINNNNQIFEMTFCERCFDAEFNTPGGNIRLVREFYEFSILGDLQGDFELLANGRTVCTARGRDVNWLESKDTYWKMIPVDVQERLQPQSDL